MNVEQTTLASQRPSGLDTATHATDQASDLLRHTTPPTLTRAASPWSLWNQYQDAASSPSSSESESLSDGDGDGDGSSDSDAQDRLHWRHMLESVVGGEVFSSEKFRLGETNFGEADLELIQEELRIGFRAKLHTRHLAAERHVVSRNSIPSADAAIRGVLDFVADGDDAQIMVAAVNALDTLDKAASYYPSLKAFRRDKDPDTLTELSNRCDALQAWVNIRFASHQVRRRVEFWDQEPNIPLSQSDDLLSRLTTDLDEAFPRSSSKRDAYRRQSIRMLRNEPLSAYYEMTCLSVIPSFINLARQTQSQHGFTMKQMGLPSIEHSVNDLLCFPLEFMQILLRVQCSHIRSYTAPSTLLLDELVENLRRNIGLSCTLLSVHKTLKTASSEGSWTCSDFDDSEYGRAVLDAVNCLVQLLGARIRIASVDRFFHEADLLNSQWPVFLHVGGVIEHGSSFIAERICVLTQNSLEFSAKYLDSTAHTPEDEADVPWPRSFQEETADALTQYERAMAGGHLRYRKLMRFVERRLFPTYHNAAEYRIRPSGTPHIIATLASLGYILLSTKDTHSIYAFVPKSIEHRRRAIARMIMGDLRTPDISLEENVNATTGVPYLLIIKSKVEVTWTGETIDHDLTTPFAIKYDRIRLIADGTERTLQAAKHHFHAAFDAEVDITPLKTAMSSSASVHKALRGVHAARAHLAAMIVHATIRAWEQLRTMSESHILLQEAFSTACEYAPLTVALKTRSDERDRSDLNLLAEISTAWLTFLSEDCDPQERRTFEWTLKALEYVKQHFHDNLQITKDQFSALRRKSGGCMSVLLGHYRVMGVMGGEDDMGGRRQSEESTSRGRKARRRGHTPIVEGQREDAVMAAIHVIENTRQTMLHEKGFSGNVLEERQSDLQVTLLASASSRISIHWKKGRYLGAGASGTVHLAVDLDSGLVMAVKEIDFRRPTIQAMLEVQRVFKQELDVLEMLRHPNIVIYHGIEVHKDKVFVFQEYCSGGSLEDVLKNGRIEDEVIVQIYAMQMFEALAYLHANGITHRDIKPGNVLLSGDGTLKLADFGTASSAIRRNMYSLNGMVNSGSRGSEFAEPLGTPMYMAPKIIRGEGVSSSTSVDIWAAGCVILHLCTGKPPWPMLDNQWSIMYHVAVTEDPPPLPLSFECTPAGVKFISRCLNLQSTLRPSAETLLADPWIINCRELLQSETPSPAQRS